MENGVTSKIFDATVISAAMGEITSFNLIERTSALYGIYTTQAVREEIERGYTSWNVEEIFKEITVIDETNGIFEASLEWLERRYPYLHRGELSTFLMSWIVFDGGGRPYYYVTDDGVMRRKVGKILKDEKLIELMGRSISKINITGTVGLIGQLYRRQVITGNEMNGVIEELRTSTFRVTEDVLDHLRRIIDEA